MNRRILISLVALVAVGAVLAMQVRRAAAIQTFVEKAKSDCQSIEAAITLIYNRDDVGDAAVQRDYFALIVKDDQFGQQLYRIDESITDRQTPWYWQTGRLETAAYNGVYNLQLWDTDDKGTLVHLIESYKYDCKTRNFWWDTTTIYRDPVVPRPSCILGVPVYTTNLAPEDGAVIFTWSGDPDYEALHFHIDTVRVSAGEGFDHRYFPVPCGVYLKLYYQPDSTKQIYLMPSQYWPHDAYGTPNSETDPKTVYYTFFPLDGPVRPPTPTPGPATPHP